MRIRYWGIRAVPTPMSLTSIGIGVVVEDPRTGEVLTRFLENPSSSLKLFKFPATLDRDIKNFQTSLDSFNTPNRTFEIDQHSSAPELLSFLSDHWNNMIVVEKQEYAAMESPSVALKKLFNILVGIDKKERRSKITEVRRLVKSEYESNELIRESLLESPHYISNDLVERRTDLAVLSDKTVFELNTAFSFETDSFTSFQDRVEAWTWKIENLRKDGGTLFKNNEEVIGLSPKTPVVATIWPPRTERQKKMFEDSTKKWDFLDIEILQMENIHQHANQLARKIA